MIMNGCMNDASEHEELDVPGVVELSQVDVHDGSDNAGVHSRLSPHLGLPQIDHQHLPTPTQMISTRHAQQTRYCISCQLTSEKTSEKRALLRSKVYSDPLNSNAARHTNHPHCIPYPKLITTLNAIRPFDIQHENVRV